VKIANKARLGGPQTMWLKEMQVKKRMFRLTPLFHLMPYYLTSTLFLTWSRIR